MTPVRIPFQPHTPATHHTSMFYDPSFHCWSAVMTYACIPSTFPPCCSPVAGMCTFNNSNCPHGFILVAPTTDMHICQLPMEVGARPLCMPQHVGFKFGS